MLHVLIVLVCGITGCAMTSLFLPNDLTIIGMGGGIGLLSGAASCIYDKLRKYEHVE
jgi:hypothetical protein